MIVGVIIFNVCQMKSYITHVWNRSANETCQGYRYQMGSFNWETWPIRRYLLAGPMSRVDLVNGWVAVPDVKSVILLQFLERNLGSQLASSKLT